jgi:hypothetical protein
MAPATDLSVLISSLSCWETAGYTGLAIVIIGVVGEGIHDFTAWFRDTRWHSGGGKLSVLILIAGLAVEGVAQVKANSISGEIIALLSGEAARLGVTIDNLNTFVAQKEADAEAQLNEFKSYAAGQKKRIDETIAELKNSETRLSKARDDALKAADASKTALEKMTAALDAERAIREQMVAVITPRDITPSQQLSIKSVLASFLPMRVDIITFGDAREIADFGRKLSETLESCGWTTKVWSAFGGASFGITGVPIFARKEAGEKADKAAFALAAALIQQQISAKKFDPFEGTQIPTSVNGPPWVETDIGDVRVYVGAKP